MVNFHVEPPKQIQPCGSRILNLNASPTNDGMSVVYYNIQQCTACMVAANPNASHTSIPLSQDLVGFKVHTPCSCGASPGSGGGVTRYMRALYYNVLQCTAVYSKHFMHKDFPKGQATTTHHCVHLQMVVVMQ